jgi:hypothetical protein
MWLVGRRFDELVLPVGIFRDTFEGGVFAVTLECNIGEKGSVYRA